MQTGIAYAQSYWTKRMVLLPTVNSLQAGDLDLGYTKFM